MNLERERVQANRGIKDKHVDVKLEEGFDTDDVILVERRLQKSIKELKLDE